MQTPSNVLNLSRLPKADGLRSLNFKRTTPGTFGRLLFPGLTFGPPVERHHPLAKINPAKYVSLLPSYRSELFRLSVFPKALLTRPEIQFPDAPPFTRSRRLAPTPNDGNEASSEPAGQAVKNVMRRQKDVSVLFHVSKKGVHSSSVVRKHIKTRIKTALSLAVTREDVDLTKMASSLESPAVGGGSLQQLNYDGWTIVIQPTLSAYRAPMEDLTSNIRAALQAAGPRMASFDAIWSSGYIPPKELLSRMRNLVQDTLEPVQYTRDREASQNLMKLQRGIHEEIEDLLLEDEEERWEKPPELTIEQKRAKLLEKTVQEALFASRPIIRPLTLDGGRAQKGRDPRRHRQSGNTGNIRNH